MNIEFIDTEKREVTYYGTNNGYTGYWTYRFKPSESQPYIVNLYLLWTLNTKSSRVKRAVKKALDITTEQRGLTIK